MIEETNLIDYAYPMMMAENAMKEAHANMLNGEHDQAVERMLIAICEARVALASIRHMQEQYDALRK
jgi:hypothetical protein